MNAFQNKIIEAMKQNELVPQESYPKTIRFNSYYQILKAARNYALETNNPVQERYCSMYLLALIESKTQPFPHVEMDDMMFDQETYDAIISSVSKGKRQFRYFAWKNALISLSLGVLIFILVVYGLQYDWKVGSAFGLIIFLIDLYANGKTNQSRYQKKLVRQFERHVDVNLIALNQHYMEN